MDVSPAGQVTQILHEVEQGKAHAADALLPLVYAQLRELAKCRMADERSGHTLQPTALVHEAYMRLVGEHRVRWAGRTHFLHAAAEAMRCILIDHARGKQSLKRGGAGRSPGVTDAPPPPPAARRVPLSVLEMVERHDPSEILDLDEAVCRLEQESPEVAAVVRLRFYAGLSIDETARALGVGAQSVKRDWAYARAWLFRQLGY
jgi:RNA polymerase sigma factor (TIGR02999 family)